MLFFTRRQFATLAIAFLIACEANPPIQPAAPAPGIQGALKHALEAAGNPDDEHEKVAAVATWIGVRYRKTFVAPSHELAALLAAQEIDPLGATVLFRAFLQQLGIRSRVVLHSSVPQYGWYPLVEILDQDGDHGWDPFGVRFFPDYDGTPRALKDRTLVPVKRLAPSTFRMEVGDDVLSPTLAELQQYPRTSLRLEAVSLFETNLDFTREIPFDFPSTSAEVFARQFESLGESQSELGPINVGQRFDLHQLVPGADYRLEVQWSQGSRQNLVLSSSGVTVASSQALPSGVSYLFKAKTSAARVSLGAASQSHFTITSLKWGRP